MPPIEEEKRRKEIESETQRLRSDIEAESKKSREEMDTLFAKQDKDLKREQRINSAKKIGGTALKGAGAAVGFVGGATIGALSDLGRNSSGGSRGHDNSEELSEGSLVLLFLLATASHFFDAIKGFQRPGFMIYIYVVLLVVAYISVFKMRIGGPEEIALVIVIALAYALPYISRLFPDNQLMLTISGLLFLIPILPLYLGLKFPNHSIIEIGSRWYMIFWVIVMIFFVLTTFAIDQKNEKLVSNPMLGVQFVIEGVSKTISKVSNSFQNVINNAVYTVTDQPNPGKQESLVGVYVEKVKPLESRYTKDSRVFIQAKIRAVNVKEPLKITTLCHIDGVKQGVTKPSVLNDVVGNYDNYFTCELGNLPPGTYTVKMQADFEFPTSSDIEYVFVNSDIKDDQFQRLGIQPNVAPVGTYTGEPIS